MTTKKRAGQSPAEPLQPDVLIIGGGVQGLWLLNELHREGYQAILLERRALGDGQTCHSHVYLHQGHLYRDVGLAERLRDVTQQWKDWLESRGSPRLGVGPSYFGFANPADAQQKEALWDDARLKLDYVPGPERPPLALEGGAVREFLTSREVCLDGEWLVEELRRDVEPLIGRIDSVRAIRVDTADVAGGSVSGGRVQEVQAVLPDGAGLAVFRPSALILAAGTGNQPLLIQATSGHPLLFGRVNQAQQVRLAFMLVVKGRRDELPPLTGVFPDLGGLFLVSRASGQTGDVVWLVSDNRSQLLTLVEDWIEYDAQWWLRVVLSNLSRLAPPLFGTTALRQRFQWGIYYAPKAEVRSGGAIPHEERIEQFGIANLWALWPTKLTLAPKVAVEVMRKLRKALGDPAGSPEPPPAWKAICQPVATAPERWKKTPLMPWDGFRRLYDL
jgi:glycine/D-amino acid oxidase-like deaminating enzyme